MITPQSIPYPIGQHFIVGLDGPVLLPSEERMIKSLQPLGIILFAKNFASDSKDWPKRLDALIADCRRASGREDLLVSVDHEGGRVHRFPAPVTHFPYARDYREHARKVARAMGTELRALGFNLSFSPVLDIDLEPINSVISQRSFGKTVNSVSKSAIEYMRGLHDVGMLSCGKHFPGHGGTTADSHLELPSRNISIEELRACELKPFQNYCAVQPPMLMSAHVLYPKIDASHPATTSHTILSSILRNELKYSGVCISDDLEMLALAHIPPGERAIQCLTAGIDLLLEGNAPNALPLELACLMANQVCESIDKAEIDIEILKQSEIRISALLDKLKNIQENSLVREFSTDCLGCISHIQLRDSVTNQ